MGWFLDIERSPPVRLRDLFSLPPKGSVKLVLGGDATLRTGYLNIIGDGVPWARMSVSFFYNLFDGTGLIDSTGTSVVHTPTTVHLLADTYVYKYSVPVEKTTNIRTGIAVTHGLRDAPAFGSGETMTLTLYDEGGSPIRIKTLNNDGHQALFVSELWGDLPTNFRGMLQVEPSGPDVRVYLTVLRLEFTEGGFQLTSTPPDIVSELKIISGDAIFDEKIW